MYIDVAVLLLKISCGIAENMYFLLINRINQITDNPSKKGKAVKQNYKIRTQ